MDSRGRAVRAELKCDFFAHRFRHWLILAMASIGFPALLAAQALPPHPDRASAQDATPESGETIQAYNRRLQQLQKAFESQPAVLAGQDYRIGHEDLLEITVFEAPEFNSVVRVSASGEVSMPMLGAVHVAGLSPADLESALAKLLRRTYMNDPHVGVIVKEMQSHPVSVLGAVKKPGMFQIRGAKTLLVILSMAEGLADDAGDTVLVMHHADMAGPSPVTSALQPDRNKAASAQDSSSSPTAMSSPGDGPGEATEEINLRRLLEFSDPALNVTVYPGDVVNVTQGGIIYVVGEVKKPGGFVLKGNQTITVLQALTLAEGLTRTSAKGQARIIRNVEQTGARLEIPVDLKRVLSGKLLDPQLQSRDILLVPNSTGRSALYRGLEAAVSVGTGLAVYRW